MNEAQLYDIPCAKHWTWWSSTSAAGSRVSAICASSADGVPAPFAGLPIGKD
ncbi:hypothetical protein [Diplocloster modestus]|uniref:Uncharacterized protein n=1 Tax=Diplocloster modestus TaxID=2850322 RepID=A0ABS6K3W4_9FIRM|nr:hypothetical protein [Diplocloster modestus]MBU9725198.1 hypothetical protein [Diplocloster modestus]